MKIVRKVQVILAAQRDLFARREEVLFSRRRVESWIQVVPGIPIEKRAVLRQLLYAEWLFELLRSRPVRRNRKA